MLRRLLAVLSFTALLAFSSASAAAATVDPFKDINCSGAAASSAVCKDKGGSGNPVTGVILRVINLIAILAGIAAVIIIIIAGISYILSGGDPSKVNNAKNTIIYAVIGLVVIAVGRTLIAFVINRL